jgi:hypothetical protein
MKRLVESREDCGGATNQSLGWWPMMMLTLPKSPQEWVERYNPFLALLREMTQHRRTLESSFPYYIPVVSVVTLHQPPIENIPTSDNGIVRSPHLPPGFSRAQPFLRWSAAPRSAVDRLSLWREWVLRLSAPSHPFPPRHGLSHPEWSTVSCVILLDLSNYRPDIVAMDRLLFADFRRGMYWFTSTLLTYFFRYDPFS